MKTSKIIPLVLFTLTIMLVTAGCSAPIEPQAPQVDEPEVVEEPSEPKEIRYGDIVVSEECRAKCAEEFINLDPSLWENYEFSACHIPCEAERGNL